jgi:glycerophosphoryl diester phosphodiesterase
MKRTLIAVVFALSACGDGFQELPEGADSVHVSIRPAGLPAYFDCLREGGFTMASAHRGGAGAGFAENAIPTFEHTLRSAPQAFLEVDVARTRDGVLVLMHDDSVDRTTTGAGDVSSLTATQFSALDMKRGVSYEDVAREVREANAMDRVVSITYSVDGAARR